MISVYVIAAAAVAAAGDKGNDCFTIGRQLTSFNRPSRVHVGAKRDSMDNIVRPFRGKITGQFVSNVRPDFR